eukprot:5119344-Pleurochrysis_carterae.AAC.1
MTPPPPRSPLGTRYESGWRAHCAPRGARMRSFNSFADGRLLTAWPSTRDSAWRRMQVGRTRRSA